MGCCAVVRGVFTSTMLSKATEPPSFALADPFHSLACAMASHTWERYGLR